MLIAKTVQKEIERIKPSKDYPFILALKKGAELQQKADVEIVEEFPDYSLPELYAYKQKILKALKGVVK